MKTQMPGPAYSLPRTLSLKQDTFSTGICPTGQPHQLTHDFAVSGRQPFKS